MASPGNQHCANCIGTLSFPICLNYNDASPSFGQRARLSTSFVDNTIDLRWRIFIVQSLGTSFGRLYPNFWSYTNFLTAQCRTGGIKPACMPKTSSIRPSVSTEYRLMIQTDRQTDKQTEWRTQGHSQYHASKIDGWKYRIGHRRTVSHDV